MPILGSRGGMSAQGFGLFGGVLKPLFPAGMFAVYYAAATYYKYTYASDTAANYGISGVAATTSFKACCANVWEGLYTVGGNTTTCQRLNWAQGTIATRSPGLVNTTQAASGTGNATMGIIPVTGTPSGTNIYTYVANTLVVGSNLGISVSSGAACSSPSFGLFCAGGSRVQPPALTNAKYFYANGAVANGAPFAQGVTNSGATSIAEYGIIGVGQGAPTLNYKYTFANDAITSGTAFKQNHTAAGAWGNDVAGIFANNGSANFSRYQYAGETTTVAGPAPLNVAQGTQGATNGVPGVSA